MGGADRMFFGDGLRIGLSPACEHKQLASLKGQVKFYCKVYCPDCQEWIVMKPEGKDGDDGGVGTKA